MNASGFFAKTKDLMVGDLLHTAVGDYAVVTAPRSGGPQGRWVFKARPTDSIEVEEHHAQPDFEWEVN